VLSEKFKNIMQIVSSARSYYSSFHRFPFIMANVLGWARWSRVQSENSMAVWNLFKALRDGVALLFQEDRKFWSVIPHVISSGLGDFRFTAHFDPQSSQQCWKHP
jgi:hypothetical protein